MDHQLMDMQNKIKHLCKDRYSSPGDFIEFTSQLHNLGVVRQTYDIVQDEFVFYSKRDVLCRFTGSDIDRSIDKGKFELSRSLDAKKLKKSIASINK